MAGAPSILVVVCWRLEQGWIGQNDGRRHITDACRNKGGPVRTLLWAPSCPVWRAWRDDRRGFAVRTNRQGAVRKSSPGTLLVEWSYSKRAVFLPEGGGPIVPRTRTDDVLDLSCRPRSGGERGPAARGSFACTVTALMLPIPRRGHLSAPRPEVGTVY